MARFLRIGTSFVVVLAAYLAYATVAVPIIEPPAEEPGSTSGEVGLAGTSIQEDDPRREFLAGLLPNSHSPGTELSLEKAKILVSEELQLVFWNYTNLGDGKVEIRPCAIIYTPNGAADSPEEQYRQAVVLEAPGGAMLEFDEPLSLSRMKIGRLKGGELKGRITIHSQGKAPGPEDDMMLVTHNVELTESHVWTPDPVLFRLGNNHGRGHQMFIKLLSSEETASGGKRGPDIAGIELFEIRRLDQLHLEFGRANPLSGGESAPSRAATPMASDLTIEISCTGPFRFEPMRQRATFQDDVNVLQLHPEGPSDQIQCDVLSLHLARSRAGVEPPGSRAEEDALNRGKGVLDLRPRRIEARGEPVVVTAPSEGVEVRGQRLDYDFHSGRIVLDGSDPVFLKQRANQIHARSLQYQPGTDGGLGQVVAAGPGRLTGKMEGKLARQFQATWARQLQIRPVDSQQVISLTGGATLDYGGLGGLHADGIHFYLSEVPPKADDPAGTKQLQPDSMQATGKVRLYSPHVSGEVDQLEVWFEQAGVTGRENRLAGGATAAVPVREAVLPHESRWGVQPAGYAGPLQTIQRPGRSAPAIGGSPAFAPEGPAAGTTPQRHFEIAAKLMRGRMVIRGRDSEPTELMLEGNVKLTETQTAKPDEQPVVVQGDRIHVVDASKPHAAVTVTGVPAHFEGRGLGLTGANINLNSGTNRLWIDGPGRMDLPWQQVAAGQSAQKPGSLSVDWQQRMSFDGRTAAFEGSIVAAAPNQDIRTEKLEVTLKEPIRFDKPPADGMNTEIDRVRCLGGVTLENQSFDAEGRSSIETMKLADLDINLRSGQTLASGPGRMTTVRRGMGDLMAQPGATQPVSLSSTERGTDPAKLTYLSIRFRGSIAGNLHDRELIFRDQVRAAYGPVDTWDTTFESEDLDALGPRGVLLSCDQLKVAQMTMPRADQKAMEMEATGSVVVEGQTFNARAVRMTYTQAKDLLLLEGDGRTDARLYYQQYVGAPYSETAAQQIWYWRSIPKVQIHGWKDFQWTQPPGKSPLQAPAGSDPAP